MLNGPLYYLTNITNSIFPRNDKDIDSPFNRHHLDKMVVVLMILDLTDYKETE